LVLNTCGESGSSAFSVGGRRTSSCKTTSVRTTSRLGRIESFSENGFSRTASLKQPSLENNFSENNFSENSFSENNFLQTARTNCEDEPRISSLRTPSPSSLRARTCTSQKEFSTQIVRRKGSVAHHRYSAAYRVWSTLDKSSAGRVHTQYHGTYLAKSVDTDFIAACLHRQPITTNTMHMRCSHHTHWVHASLSRGEKIDKNAIVKGIVEIGRCGGRE